MMKCNVIYGPPGTGKTASLLAAVEREIDSGIEPERIAFVSFTKAAADEAKLRGAQRLSIPAKRLRHFKTLHATAFAALGLKRDRIMSDYREFAGAVGISVSKFQDEDAARSDSLGDAFIHANSLCRSARLDYHEAARKYDLRLGEPLFARLQLQLEKYKEDSGKLEFVDLPDLYIRSCDPLDVDVAFIDEAQDLTPQQWAMTRHAFRKVDRIYIAGDDDQAIYQWAGADALHMLKIKGEQTILDHSYRLPRNLQMFSQLISGRINSRQPKSWTGTDGDGLLQRHAQWNKIPFDNKESWLVLVRNRSFITDIAQRLEACGVHFSVHGAPRLSAADVEMYKARIALRAGETIKGAVANRILAETPGDHARFRADELVDAKRIGAKLDALLARWSGRKLSYIARLGEVEEPRIDLTTIHQSKGREADNVVLSPDISAAVWSRLGDAEHRTFYVGATRARKRLYLLDPCGEFHYKLP